MKIIFIVITIKTILREAVNALWKPQNRFDVGSYTTLQTVLDIRSIARVLRKFAMLVWA